jgi:sec-independent protein translocase protein TatB
MNATRWCSSPPPNDSKSSLAAPQQHVKPPTAQLRVAAIRLRLYDDAMSFSDTIFLFFLVLILFGPKKLPEMARQAGRLLAELRRASNEFKSQIETEIAHLEVEKPQTVLPPLPSPQGTVASRSLNPAISEPVPQPEPATLAASPEPAPLTESPAAPSGAESTDASKPATELAAPVVAPTSQDSHV